MAVQQDLDAEVSDISTAFPNAEVPDGKGVYMAIPQGAELYYKMDLTNKYLRVWQALYGLRKSPRAFNQHLHGWMVKQVFTQSKIDPCLYFREQNGKMLWVLVYVDDLFMVGVPALVKEFKGQLDDKFTKRLRRGLWLHHPHMLSWRSLQGFGHFQLYSGDCQWSGHLCCWQRLDSRPHYELLW